MRSQDFKCHPMKNSRFTERLDGRGGRINHPPADFLHCDSGQWGFIMTKRWQVFITEQDGVVVGVFASVGLMGP